MIILMAGFSRTLVGLKAGVDPPTGVSDERFSRTLVGLKALTNKAHEE